MADFCDRCAEKMGFEPDFVVTEVFKGLHNNYYTTVLCEGCAMGAVGNQEGKMVVADVNGGDWMDIEEYFKLHGDI